MLTWTLACREVAVYSEPPFFCRHIREASPAPVVLFTLLSLAGLKWSHRDWHFYCKLLSQRFTVPVPDTSHHLWWHFGLCGNVRPAALVCRKVFLCTPTSPLVTKKWTRVFLFFRTLCCPPTCSPGCVCAQHGWPGPGLQVPAVQRGRHLHPPVGQHGQAQQSKRWDAFKVPRAENSNFLKLALLTLRG